jgi:hypothetical protein
MPTYLRAIPIHACRSGHVPVAPAPAAMLDDLDNVTGVHRTGVRRRLAHVVLATLMLCTAGAACTVVRHAPHRGVVRANAGTIAHADDWVQANLPPGTRVGVDFEFPGALGPKEPIVLDVLSLGEADWRAETFVLSTPELRHESGFLASVSGALGSSLPVAIFGRGATRVELRQIATDGLAALTRRWRDDVATRRLAGVGLLRNPRVEKNSSAQSVLRRGGLDLRASILIALLAAKTDIRILDVATDPAEAAFDRPARSVRVSLADSAVALSSSVATLSPGLRPSSVTRLRDGVVQLRWAVAVAPVALLE